jgi:hypothetical protein
MSKRGGYAGGMPGNMNNLMKQAQRMQKQLEEQQKEFETQEFTASAGGGAVEVVMTGNREMKSVTISPDALDPDDIEMLQDMIVAATNEVLRKIDENNTASMNRIAGGLGNMGLGGLM